VRKRIKKIQLKRGIDAKQAEVHKLTTNFIKWGKLTTTDRKAKYVKSIMDRLTYKAIKNSQADHDVLTSAIRNKKLVDYMVTTVAGSFKDRTTGFTTLSKFAPRQGDGATTAQIRWISAVEQFIKPVVVEQKDGKKTEINEGKEDPITPEVAQK